jgi:hypothetical protein
MLRRELISTLPKLFSLSVLGLGTADAQTTEAHKYLMRDVTAQGRVSGRFARPSPNCARRSWLNTFPCLLEAPVPGPVGSRKQT